LSHADFRDGARALQSRIPNKQTISEKIPSLFAFLARVSRMMRAIIGRKILQISPEKMEMKNIPGAFTDNKQRESNQSAEVLRYKCLDRRALAAVSVSLRYSGVPVRRDRSGLPVFLERKHQPLASTGEP
jgi:hypothetical protein